MSAQTQKRKLRIRQGNQWVEQEVTITPCKPSQSKFAQGLKPAENSRSEPDGYQDQAEDFQT